MPSQQSPSGPSSSLPPNHVTEIGGLLPHRLPLSLVCLTPNPGLQSFLGLSLSNTDSTWCSETGVLLPSRWGVGSGGADMITFCRTRVSSGPGPSGESSTAPLCSSCACSPGTRAFTHCPLRGVGSRQEVDCARDQKPELGVQWKEGASVAHKTSGEWMGCSEQIPPPLTRGKRGKAQTWGGRIAKSSALFQ